MARILFAWELGGDYGHIARLLPIAHELAARGHQCLFAVRDLLSAETLLTPSGFSAFQAPLWLSQVTNLPPAIGYAEMLMRFGFLNPKALTGICRAWRSLIDVLAADLLVLDHAPTALLATRGLGLPRLHVGDGFCIPPSSRPLPPFRWWTRENILRLTESEEQARRNANAAILALEGPPLASLGELFQAEATMLCTFPELDHYPSRSGPNYLGPIFSRDSGAPVAWPNREGSHVFAYVKPGYPGFEAVLSALSELNAAILVHAPGAAKKTVAKFSSAGMAFSEEPVDIDQVRATCRLTVCHGGAGTTSAMLLAGRPLLLLPMQMEQTMLAKRLVGLGVARAVFGEDGSSVKHVLKAALTDEGLQRTALGFASRHATYDARNTIRAAADCCEKLLARKLPNASQ